MSKRKKQKNSNLWIIIISLIFILIIALTLLYFEKYKYNINSIQYFKIERLVSQSNNYVIASNLSIVSKDNKQLKSYEKEIKVILEKTIFNTELSQLDNADKITLLQQNFRKNLKEELPELKISKVIITDFIYTIE